MGWGQDPASSLTLPGPVQPSLPLGPGSNILALSCLTMSPEDMGLYSEKPVWITRLFAHSDPQAAGMTDCLCLARSRSKGAECYLLRMTHE